MSAIKVNFEIGHEASVRSKKTPEGFTHDWEVFVTGQEGADIIHFVDKVVFHLHETFPKPRRVVKEPPFSVKESGYAGFIIPIDIYLKNKDEPKMIQFTYDLTLQQRGFLKDRYIFQSPNEDFRKKLLKGGGILISNNAFYTNPDQESRSRDSFTEEKQQLVSKPKLSSENVKKHKSKEHKDEIPHRTSSFETLFGAPLQKPPKVSPDPKKVIEKNMPTVKSEKKEKERSSIDKKSKYEQKEAQKEAKPEKVKIKEEKDKNRSEKEKIKNHSKEQEKIKEKASKRPIERPISPEAAKKRCISPNRRPPSPPPRSSSATSIKEEYKPPKHNSDSFEQKKPKLEPKIEPKAPEKDIKEKKKKEKKSHDKDKERKEKKDHKKGHKSKESPKEPPKELPKETIKSREITKEKEPTKESPPVKEKQPKPEKTINKFSLINLTKTPPPENDERSENHKTKEKSDSERKHKHKKKDKKRDESREKHKESSKEKKHKHEKIRELPSEKIEIIERKPTPIPKDRLMLESASPISVDTASQCSSKSGLIKASHIGAEDINSNSDSEGSLLAEEEDIKVKIENPSPEPIKREPSPEPEPDPEPEADPEPDPEPEPVVEPPPQQKEKSKKHKDKSSKREEKRRKRKAAEEEDAENRKSAKISEGGPSNNDERGETSGSASTETKVQDNGVSSSLGEDAEPGDLSPDYMVQLRGLQQRIMTIKNNEDLERVVNLIAETGRYEVTTQTFDFDLCLLDRSTVQQLIQLVGC